MDRTARLDPYRVLGVPPGAPLDEVKAAYRRLAKRHHPDAAGPAQLQRFLVIQQAYESIARASRNATRPGGPASRGGAPSRGPQSEAGRDWYTAAREAARARARAGRGQGSGPRARAGWQGAAGQGTSGAGRSSAASDEARDPAWRRRATLGSTTYDDAVAEPPSWQGAAWYGQASGTYWTVNPREYADPRKHGPGYLGRATEWTGDRPDPVAPEPGAPDPGPGAGRRSATTPAGPDERDAGRAARIAAALRAALGRPDRRGRRVR